MREKLNIWFDAVRELKEAGLLTADEYNEQVDLLIGLCIRQIGEKA